MQIFPNETNKSAIDFLFNINPVSADGDKFSAYLELAQGSVNNNNDEFSGFEALDEAPYSPNVNTDSELYAFGEVGFSKVELFQLHQDLVRAGAMPADLAKLRELIDNPDGASISQILESLTPKTEPVLLTEAEQSNLETLLLKVDPTGELKDRVNLLVEEGQGFEAWSAISEKLSTLDQNKNINVTKDEIAALGKAMGLSEQGQEQLLSGFGSFTALDTNPAGLQKLLGPAQATLTTEITDQENLQKALELTLGPILQKANERFQEAKDAASLLSKNVQHSNILIKEVVTEEVRTNLEQTVTDEKNAEPEPNGTGKNGQRIKNENAQNVMNENIKNENVQGGKPENVQGGKPENVQGGKPENVQGSKPENVQGSKPENSVIVNSQMLENNNSNKDMLNNGKNDANNENLSNEKNLQFVVADNNTKKDNSHSNQSDNKDSGWDNLLGKVEVQQTTTKSDAVFSQIMGLQNNANENAAKNTPNGSTRSGYNEQNVAKQVERGLLSAMQNGSKRLELSLNPGDLGTINLILTSNRNGEISASIRSDRPETTEVMQRQLDIIRVNLEQQGIKIEKLEVQYEPQGKQNGESWKDLQQHNNQQEQQARQEQLERLRNLRNIRNADINPRESILAQNVHLSTATANNASQNLYVVA